MPFVFQPPKELTRVDRRQRYLPHWEQAGCTYFLTWRMADSVPESVLRPWLEERARFRESHPEPWDTATLKTYNTLFTRRMEEWLDAGHGSCALRAPEARAIVERCLRYHQGQRYDLSAWVIMPNHVHVLVKPLPAGEANESDTDTSVCSEDLDDTEQTRVSVSRLGSCHSLSSILKSWKGISSRQINRDRERNGSFWMDETFDHIVRSESQLLHFRNYIRENPVKAGLGNDEFTLWMGEDEVPTK
jgi:REP element-mobilizing transposase RayT